MSARPELKPTLLNRTKERAALDGLLRDVRSGRGGVLVVRGEPGVGKSAGAIERVLQASFPGLPESVRDARRQVAAVVAGIPVANDVVLCLSEVATNAIVHSRSGRPGGEFTVTADVVAGALVVLAVADQGGPWAGREADTYPHGLEMARGLALSVRVEGDADGRTVRVVFPWAWKEES